MGAGGHPYGTVVLTLDARPENLALTRLALAGVAANAGAPRDVVADLKLAVTEACGNVVRHAYGDDPGDVFVSYVVRDDAIEILVEDRGKGLEEQDASTGAVAAPPDGGMGMAIIRTIVDDLAIDVGADGRGTVIRMTKRLAPGPALAS
jgi:serine/threonine-protein kinase RsbW